MTFAQYVDLQNDPRGLRAGVYRVDPGSLPPRLPRPRPAPPPPTAPPRRAASRPARPASARSTAPRYVCGACYEPAHLDTKGRCPSCAAEIGWRVGLARQGLKVVS